MASYEIVVKRGTKSGTLSFTGGGVAVVTTCWWDPAVVVTQKPDGYPAWRTRMATKTDSVTKEKRPGIWLGKGIPYGDGAKTSDGIFIHEGDRPSWSDGCIVCVRAEMMKIWDAIVPNGSNVVVKITDEPVA